ncbi:hypothetical protein MKEN_01343200 [Mycena kentingensis (nom. inval.)]|nr:hypothetical protein MKEN_01343200 [Mycena kentingensis (nom. inval.)]
MFSAIPATTHSLPARHRTQLLRTTRKLEAVLGETPLLVDASMPPPPSSFRPSFTHARSRSLSDVFGHDMENAMPIPTHAAVGMHSVANDSAVSLCSVEKRPNTLKRGPSQRNRNRENISTPPQRPVLMINVPPPYSTDMEVASPQHSAALADSPMLVDSPWLVAPPSASSIPPSPLSPSAACNQNNRRRRMSAKIARMLGENIPPSILFRAPGPPASAPPPTPITSSRSKPARYSTEAARRRASTLSIPESMRERLRHFTSPSVPSPTVPLPPLPTGVSASGATGLSRSGTMSSTHSARSRLTLGSKSSRESLLPRPKSKARRESILPPQNARQKPLPAPINTRTIVYEFRNDLLSADTRRRELAWSGEWGGALAGGGAVNDMEDVMRGLRELRCK